MSDVKTGRLSRRTAFGAMGGAALAAGALAQGQARAQGAQEATPGAAREVPTPDPSLAFKVVLHVGDQSGWPFALSNLKHLTATYKNAKVRVVVDGTGIYAIRGENDLVQAMAAVAAAGAEFQVCAAALAEHNIDPATVPSFAAIVAGGVVALVQAQADGYAYVRP